MTYLEKLKALLSKDGRTVKLGTLTNETADPVLTLQVGESTPAASHMGDRAAVSYANLVVNVFAGDYITGFNLIELAKSEIKAAQKESTKIFFVKDLASTYDKEKAKYIFTSHFKIIL